jgi:hypothetical protein
MNVIENVIGLKYNSKAITINKDNEVSCNGLICLISDTYRELTEQLKSPTDFRNLESKLNNIYDEINFENRQALDIIFFKEKQQRNFTHVAMLLTKDDLIHNEQSKFGARIEDIRRMLFFNRDFKIYRERN